MLAGALAGALALAPAAAAYLKLGFQLDSGAVVGARWGQPIRYLITNRDVPGATASDLRDAVQRAFATWAAVPNVSIASQFGGFTDAEPFVDDSLSVIGFRSRPDLDRTLAATTFQIDNVTGDVVEADIFVNSAFPWSVAANGQPPNFDVQSILTHEVGHFLGLSHSALGETTLLSGGDRRVLGAASVMFPIAYPGGNIADRTLKADDAAGISDLYGSAASRREVGSVNGRVLLNGAGVFGAHVTAFNPATGALVGGFSLDTQGRFVIGELSPGTYLVRAEPLDDADVTSFFDSSANVNINFKPTYYAHLVSVPAGGSSAAIEIKVSPK